MHTWWNETVDKYKVGKKREKGGEKYKKKNGSHKIVNKWSKLSISEDNGEEMDNGVKPIEMKKKIAARNKKK